MFIGHGDGDSRPRREKVTVELEKLISNMCIPLPDKAGYETKKVLWPEAASSQRAKR